MSVTLVTANFSTKYKGFNAKNPYVSEVSHKTNDTISESNYLIDTNYGSSLVKQRQVSFTGAVVPPAEIANGIIPLSKKIAAAMPALKNDDVLLIGSNFVKGVDLLKKSIDSVPKVINRLLFIEEKDLKSTVAISKSNRGFDEIINLSEKKLKMLDARNKELFIEKGDSVFIEDGDKILTEGVPIDIESGFEKGFTDIRKKTLKVFDFSKFEGKEIEKLNLKNLEKLNVKKAKPQNPIKFADVGGQDEAIAELKRKFYYPIKNPNFFKAFDSTRSALMVGPPGTGKSLTAQALANELGIPFFDINGQLLEGSLVGESAAKIHNYYEMLKENQPCIAFFDEVEAVLGKRTGKYKYADDSVNMHLDEISKIEKENAEVYLLAATNRPELIDPAAMRSGRFGTKIPFYNPDTVEKCKTIFNIHSKKLDIDNFNLDEFAQKLLNAKASGADIADITAEAKINSVMRQGIFEQMEKGVFVDKAGYKLQVSGEDFDKAIENFEKTRKTVDEFAESSQKTRQEEIKNELLARQEAEKEIKTLKSTPPITGIGFLSAIYK